MDFKFTYETHRETAPKIRAALVFEGLLNEKLLISDYGQEIKEILFVYIAVDPLRSLPKEGHKKFIKKSKTLEVAINIDYHNFVEADEKAVKTMFAGLYLKSIREQMDFKGFDNDRFYKDVENLFVENKLLPTKPEDEVEVLKRNFVNKLRRVKNKTTIKKLADLLDKETAAAI